VGVGFLELVKAIAPFWNGVAATVRGIWNGIIGALQAVLGWVGKLDIAGWKPFEFLLDVSKQLGSYKIGADALTINVEELAKKIALLKGLTYEEALAKARAAAATNEAAAAMNKFSESLTNVPEGFRVAAARYGATSPAGESFAKHSSRGGGIGGSDAAAATSTTVVVVKMNSKEIASEVEEIRRETKFASGKASAVGDE